MLLLPVWLLKLKGEFTMRHKTNSQKQWVLAVMSIVASILILPSLIQAGEILFEDTFDKANDKLNGTGKWHTVSGAWAIKNDKLVQGQRNGKNLILASDSHWDEEWNDYWFYSTVKFASGESPLIIWRFHSDEGAGFGPKAALPPRMQESLSRHVIYWALNREGKRSVVHRVIKHVSQEFAKTETKTKLDKGKTYWIKIENHPKGYRLFLTDNGAAAALGNYGPALSDVKDINISGRGRIGFGTEEATIEVDNVYVTEPEKNPFAVEAQGRLTTTWGLLKSSVVQ